jgi:hypothetical protein
MATREFIVRLSGDVFRLDAEARYIKQLDGSRIWLRSPGEAIEAFKQRVFAVRRPLVAPRSSWRTTDPLGRDRHFCTS